MTYTWIGEKYMAHYPGGSVMESIIRGDRVKYLLSTCGYYRDKPGSIQQITHDGDTIKIFNQGNISVRFLGIDTPEISFTLDGKTFISTENTKWKEYFADIDAHWPTMKTDLGEPLYTNLHGRIDGRDVAANHYTHAVAAKNGLVALIEKDVAASSAGADAFVFFLALSYEMFDTYGRVLAFVHKNDVTNKPLSYNYALLDAGLALPYFIWPNINPYRKEASILAAAYANPREFLKKTRDDDQLANARKSVDDARKNKKGMFAADGLMLEAFELRCLARRSAPSRAFIDLNSDDPVIKRANEYFTVLPENRLFIPDHYEPLFREKGWK
jgi:endonuclease YncB( thermonuclease family)